MTFIRGVSLMLVVANSLSAQAQQTAPPKLRGKGQTTCLGNAVRRRRNRCCPFDSVTPQHVPGSTAAFTELRAQTGTMSPTGTPSRTPPCPTSSRAVAGRPCGRAGTVISPTERGGRRTRRSPGCPRSTSHGRWPRCGPAREAVPGTHLTSRRTSCAVSPTAPHLSK